MKKIISFIVACTLALLTVQFTVAAAQAVPDGTYMIQLKNTSLFMNLRGGYDSDGNPVQLYGNDGTASGMWRVENLGDGKVRIYSLASSNGYGRVLDTTGSNVDIYSIGSYVNDNTFYIQREYDGYFTIRRAADHSKVIEAVSVTSGYQLSLLGYKSWATQHWSFNRVGGGSPGGGTAYSYPVRSGVGHVITAGYHDQTYYNYYGAVHNAIDIAGGSNLDILSVADGTVIAVGTEPSYPGNGLVVRIQHAGGIVSRYSHLSRTYVNVGDSVSKSGIIATMGNTGGPYGVHLHFQFLQNGSFIDPNSLIDFPYGSMAAYSSPL